MHLVRRLLPIVTDRGRQSVPLGQKVGGRRKVPGSACSTSIDAISHGPVESVRLQNRMECGRGYELHQFRIICKKFRYTLELFAPTFGPALNARMEVIKRAQGLLGDINDYDTVRRILSSYKGDERLVLWLKKRQRRRVEDFHRFWSQMLASRAEMQGWRAFLASAGSVHAWKSPTTRSQRVSPPSDG